jgi:hypothetical protein
MADSDDDYIPPPPLSEPVAPSVDKPQTTDAPKGMNTFKPPAPPPPTASRNQIVSKNTSNEKVLNAGPQSKPTVTATAKQNGANHLFSILNKMEATNKFRDANASHTTAADKVKASVMDQVHAYESEIKEKIEELLSNKELNEITIDTTNDPQAAYIIHDTIANEYPELVSTSVGAHDDRRVIVYRKGYQPQELTMYTIEGTVTKGSKSKSSASAVINPSPELAAKLIKVNTVKRDRREVADIIAEKEKKRKLIDATTSQD